MNATWGGTIQPESIETYVVFDADVGEVHHIHRVFTFKGGAKTSSRDAEIRALSHAKSRLSSAGNLRVIQVPSEALKPGIVYAVDLGTLTLIAKERPRPSSKHA